MSGHTDSPPPEREQFAEVVRRHYRLIAGLEKAVLDPEVEWVDANIIRLLLGRAAVGETPMQDSHSR